MGFHLKHIWEWNRTVSYYVVIALIVGAGAGYIIGNSPVKSLEEEKDWLEGKYDSLYLAYQDLEAELNSTQFLLDAYNRSTEHFMSKYVNLLQEFFELEAEIARLDDLEKDYAELKELLMGRIGPLVFANLTIEPAVIELGGNVTISFYISNILPESVDWSFAPYIEGPDQGYSIMDSITLGGHETKKISYVETPWAVGNYTVEIGGLTGFFEVL